jgi:hypothetical protein
MRKRSPRWMTCTSDSGALLVSPRLRTLYVRAADILEADDHLCPICMFEAIVDLLGIGESAEMMHERGRRHGQAAPNAQGKAT